MNNQPAASNRPQTNTEETALLERIAQLEQRLERLESEIYEQPLEFSHLMSRVFGKRKNNG